jgi:hypothetical protein
MGGIEYAVKEKGFLFGVDENVAACKTVSGESTDSR